MKKKEIKNSDVIEILNVFKNTGIDVWLDGGWGVDALLEKQTRIHRDIDVVIQVDDVKQIRAIFKRKGFKLVSKGTLTSFTLRDKNGREIDVHAVKFDKKGNGIYRMKNGEDWIYPAEGFTGRGKISGRKVRCLSAKTQMLCHTGYKLMDKDFNEMKLLHKEFKIDYPKNQRGLLLKK